MGGAIHGSLLPKNAFRDRTPVTQKCAPEGCVSGCRTATSHIEIAIYGVVLSCFQVIEQPIVASNQNCTR